MIYVGNAPCSWGTLEFEGVQSGRLLYSQVLDEISATGYTGTELGDWAFMPTDPAALKLELLSRGLTMTGAFCPIDFRNRLAHDDGETDALKIARQLAAVGDAAHPPFLVLADDNCNDPARTKNAGRITPEMQLDAASADVFVEGVQRVARKVVEETGIRSVFHHHCGGYVETPDEIDRLLAHTDAETVGLVFDTGHAVFGSGVTSASEQMAQLNRWADRICYVHLKDCSPKVMADVKTNSWDYHTAIRHGVFCELAAGCVPFARVIDWLRARNYDGFVTVEQDMLPGMGSPKDSARRNREYLGLLGL
jgi:inosose dehydratase